MKRQLHLYREQPSGVSQKSIGLFIQNDRRVTPKLTINAGLRYDLTFPIHEQDNLLSNFDPAVGLVQVSGHRSNRLKISSLACELDEPYSRPICLMTYS